MIFKEKYIFKKRSHEDYFTLNQKNLWVEKIFYIYEMKVTGRKDTPNN